jgi:hypothetical protein
LTPEKRKRIRKDEAMLIKLKDNPEHLREYKNKMKHDRKKRKRNKKKMGRKKTHYNPTFSYSNLPNENLLIPMMEKNTQRGRKKIQETQKQEYKKFYQEITPALRLFYFLKSNDKLMHEALLNDFQAVFEECGERNEELQKKFNAYENENPNIQNRVRRLYNANNKTEEMRTNIQKFVETTLKEIKDCRSILKSRNFTNRI